MSNRVVLAKVLVGVIILLLLFGAVNMVSILQKIINPILGPLGVVPVSGSMNLDILVPYLEGDVIVKYDNTGIPYIEASSPKDLYLVFGFIQAKDRLFQMDLMRRYASGRLSELFGPDFIETDKHFKVIGLHRAAGESYRVIVSNSSFKELLSYMEAYTEGINLFIEYAKERHALPPEYYLLGAEPEPWTPVDSLAIGRLISWGLAGGTQDLQLLSFLEANGYEALLDLDLLNASLNLPILSSFTVSSKVVAHTPYTAPPNTLDSLKDLIRIFEENEMLIRRITGLAMSNNWVVSGKITDTGYPLLANDPHLSLQAPPVWYEAELIFKGKATVFGVTFPGIPFIIIGRNTHVAWGFTNVGADVLDFYYYKWDGERYLYNGMWLEPKRVHEDIIVNNNGVLETIPFTVNITVHGPLYEYKGVKYAMRWTGHLPTLELVAFYYYNFAEDIYDMIRGARYFSVPAQNLVAADDKGNILYYPAGLYPIRGNRPIITVGDIEIPNMGFLPFNGSAGEGEWISFIPFEDIPHAINPEEGFVATANNRLVPSDYPYYLGWRWADRYRYERIATLIQETLAKKGKISIEDMMRIQRDIHSLSADYLLPMMLQLVKKASLTEDALQALNLLSEWDREMSSDQIAPSIYVAWLYNLHRGLWGDEAEKAGIGVGLIPMETTEYYLRMAVDNNLPIGYTRWIGGDIKILLANTLNDAVNKLKSEFGDDMENWRWGNVLRYRIKHPVGDILTWLNYPEYDGQGGLYTVCVAGFNPEKMPYIVGGASSIRYIANLQPADENKLWGYIVLPGGNSGNPFNKHYHDQLETWVNREYNEIIMIGSTGELQDFDCMLVFRGGG